MRIRATLTSPHSPQPAARSGALTRLFTHTYHPPAQGASTGTLRATTWRERPHHPGEKCKRCETWDNQLFPDPIHADRGGVLGSGLLADELYWPTPKSLTPALRFGFAVDGGDGLVENEFIPFRSTPKKCYRGQANAKIVLSSMMVTPSGMVIQLLLIRNVGLVRGKQILASTVFTHINHV